VKDKSLSMGVSIGKSSIVQFKMEEKSKQARDIIEELIPFLRKVHRFILRSATTNFKESVFLQCINGLHQKVMSLQESILVLTDHFKYSDLISLQRTMFETAFLMWYLQGLPFEAKRWLDWTSLTLDQQRQIPRRKEEVLSYLAEEDYSQIKELLESHPEFINGAMRFSPTVLRRILHLSIHNSVDDPFKNYYWLTSGYTHANFTGIWKQGIFSEFQKTDSELTSLYLLLNASGIFMEVMHKSIDQEQCNRFDEFFADGFKSIQSGSELLEKMKKKGA